MIKLEITYDFFEFPYTNPSTINEITPPNILRRPQIFKASITNGYVKTIDTFDDGNCNFFSRLMFECVANLRLVRTPVLCTVGQ